ncbi:MAG TPA: VOC family protein [Thermoplasmata archaeon]|nr:VOC family protein [Thermoplasmata archaeon]
MAFKSEHVTLIPVRKLPRALRFYTQALGAKLRARGAGAMRNSWAHIRVGGAEVWLIAPPEREKRSLAYSTFVVKNIRKAVKQLRRAGAKFQRAPRGGMTLRTEGPIAFERIGALAFFQDPEGNLLMLWQEGPVT